MNEITLESLCGKHTFSGCEITSEDVEGYYGVETCAVCLFTIDGVTYKAVENQDYGYRSFCEELEVSEKKPRYSFAPVEVACSMMESTAYSENDVLVIRDLKNGKTILQVGTTSCDDYYPYCLFEYTPENMACNQ